MSLATRLAMIDRTNDRVSLIRRCQLVEVNQSLLCYQTKVPGARTLELIRRTDEQYPMNTCAATARV